LDPNSGQKMGDLRSYLHWPTGLLDIPGLVEEPVSEPVDGQIKIKINKAGQLVVLDQHTEQLSLAFTCEGEAVSFDLHLDHHTIIVGDNKGKIYFLQIEGYPPQS
jgi:hypothetical protein